MMAGRVDFTELKRPSPARVLACGAYLKNRACLLDGDRVLWSPVHGDLGEADACVALEQSVQALLSMASGPLDAVAHDLHPDFHSTRVALHLAQRLGAPAIAVQHHHAHIAVTLAEDAVVEPVMGLALDGVGLGDDGLAWGGEVLWVYGSEAAHQWRRLDHLVSLPMPGADRAAREPWRMAAAALHVMGRTGEIGARFAPVVGPPMAHGVQRMLERNLQCPLTSSAGRWFDAAAGALGLSVRQSVEAEAAMALENQARQWLLANPNHGFSQGSLDLRPVMAELFDPAGQGPQALARGAALFHLALAHGLARHTIELAREHGCGTVVFGGGCFFNQVLSQILVAALKGAGLQVLEPRQSGCGDAGLALGQAWIAACAVQAGSTADQCRTVPALEKET